MEDILKRLVTEVEGATGSAVGGIDGLLIEQYTAGDDLSNTVAEHANLLRNARFAYTETLETGELHEMMVATDRLVGYTHPIGSEYFVVLLLDPTCNLGKARLRSSDAAAALREMIGI
jgi:uncharacterized protein